MPLEFEMVEGREVCFDSTSIEIDIGIDDEEEDSDIIQGDEGEEAEYEGRVESGLRGGFPRLE